MTAGGSALRKSRLLLDESEALFDLAALKKEQARSYAVASASEAALAGRLRHLDQLGWTVLEDRLWPSSKRANVDFILVGPGGVVVLDAKAWGEVSVHDGGLYRGQAREDDEIDKLHRLSDQLADALSPIGVTPSTVSVAMVFTGRSLTAQVGGVSLVGDSDVVRWLASLPLRLADHSVAGVATCLADACPPAPPEPPAAVLRPRHRRPAARLEQTEVLVDSDQLARTLLETALAGPIEEWMTFLHPDQARLVRTTWNGPARVRGPAGTGKTVVGLHRAVHLAQRTDEPVLFVSYVKTLPVVLASLARRLSPTAGDRIEFVGVHALAARCLRMVGEQVRIDLPAADRAFAAAWEQSGGAGRLARLDPRSSYWREEVDHVIKGRGLTDFEQYADLQRVGRKTPMRADDRAAMWELFECFQRRLVEAGAGDFNDLLLRATSAVERFPDLFRYASVVVDEVQDLNLAAVRFLCALAGDGTNQLLFIGDGQQSVYPGGFTLAEAGVTVTGRAAVLKENYRNTAEILAEAQRMVSGDTFDDLEGLPEAGERDVTVSRHGHPPVKVWCRTRADLERAVGSQLSRTRAALGTAWGDMAVLVERRRDAARHRAVLTRAGIPCVDLVDYDGVTTDRVKVGTIKRAKGLEFRYVLMPGLTEQPPAQVAEETDEAYAERIERWRRELYVGMTRARDGLWLGYVRTAQ